MADDTRPDGHDANSEANGTVSAEFNRKQDLADQIARLSPKALEQAKFVEKLGQDRLDNERKAQQRFHAHRVMKEENKLLKNYILDRSERPEEIRIDPTPDLQVIAEQAERNVGQREAFYMREIERGTEANLRQIVAQDRQGGFDGHDGHDQEPEHE